jgi:hypothetical protein
MGLDMYLEARRFVSGYSHSKDEEKELFKTITEAVGMDGLHDERFATVSVNVAYWRKANHIHDWFVREVQGGEDNCGSYYVSREKLRELGELCQRICENGTEEFAHKNLPTASGFFFGGTDYDEYYFESTHWTAKRLAEIAGLPEGMNGYDFYYNSSW